MPALGFPGAGSILVGTRFAVAVTVTVSPVLNPSSMQTLC
jgi:hypothetical protein